MCRGRVEHSAEMRSNGSHERTIDKKGRTWTGTQDRNPRCGLTRAKKTPRSFEQGAFFTAFFPHILFGGELVHRPSREPLASPNHGRGERQLVGRIRESGRLHVEALPEDERES